MKRRPDFNVNRSFLEKNPNTFFVFGDNTTRCGTKGAAKLRHFPNSIGFITKRVPSYEEWAYYKPGEYEDIFNFELAWLKSLILSQPDKMFYISKLGSGLANKYGIFEAIIKPRFEKEFKTFDNVTLLW